MNREEYTRLAEQLRSELTGEQDRDRATLMEWAERYRGSEEAGPLLHEIGLLLFHLDEEVTAPLTEGFLDELLEQTEAALARAEAEMEVGRYEQAAAILAPAAKEIDGFPLRDDTVWTDYHSFLDGLLYEDYFSEEIDGREVRRHPLRPARLLQTYGEALMQLEQFDKAVQILEGLVALDPVCPERLCMLAEAYLTVGQTQDAWDSLCWALLCASEPEEAARCYLLLAACLIRDGNPADAVVLLQKSLRVGPSPEAEEALAELAKQMGTIPAHSADELNRRCGELDVPTGRSEIVEQNLAFLQAVLKEEEAPEGS